MASKKDFFNVVIDYCGQKQKNSFHLAEMVAVVTTVKKDPSNEIPFDQIMAGIQQVLQGHDCRHLASAMTLLGELYNVAQGEVATVWRTRLKLLRKLTTFSKLHLPWSKCDACQYICETSKIFETIFKSSDLKSLTCEICKVSCTELIFPCEHMFCKPCLVELFNRANEIRCPVDGTFIQTDWMNTSGKDGASPGDQNIPVLTNCPKCMRTVTCFPQEQIFLAECKPCNHLFCTNCLEAYHGYTDCKKLIDSNDKPATPPELEDTNLMEVNDKEIEKNATSASAPPQDNPERFSASAMSYELDFYKSNDAEKIFGTSDIASAFKCNHVQDILPNVQTPWPWETNIRQYGYHEFVHPFQSLRAGNWVEDEIFEAAMKSMLKNEAGLDGRFCILESFVCNWSTRSSYEDGEFIRILQEKNLLEKEVILSLINTDMRGHGGHWILGVINVPKQLIFIFDSSLVLSPTFYQKFFFCQLHIMHVASQLKNRQLDFDKWKLIVSLDSVQQQNAYDCGPLVVANAFAITKNVQLDLLPNGGFLRSWIFESVSKFREVSVPSSPDNIFERNVEIAPFLPFGLSVDYKFLKGRHLFRDL
jgi:hypothetical protein